MKNLFHRALSLLLSAVLLVGLISTPAMAAEEAPPAGSVLLEGVGITLREGVETEGMTFSAFAAVGVDANGMAASDYEVPERGCYGVTIYRTGDLSLSSELRVSALDISASYGTDYRLLDRGGEAVVTGVDETVIEIAMTPEARQRAEEEAARLQSEALAELREEGAAAQPEAEAEPAPEDGEAVNASPLARMMEEQTGEPARTPAGQEISDFSDSLISYLGGMPTDYFEPSAVFDLTFAPGETEKQIWFEILDDAQSEGKEAFSLILDGRIDTSFVVTPYMCTVAITDDEPVEHSVVSFSQAAFTADESSVKVTVERSGAEYSYATVGIRSVQDGTARRGLNFAYVNTELEFLPNQTTAELTIPVAPDPEVRRDFSLELCDPLGCDTGALSRAQVTIPVKIPADAGDAELMASAIVSGTGYTDGSTIELSGTQYTLKASGNDGVFKLMQGSHYAGDLYMPSLFKYWMGGADEPNSSSDASYHASSAGGKGGPVGHLKWYSNWIGETGWACARYNILQPERYQLVYVDVATDSSLVDVSMGWGVWLQEAKTADRTDRILQFKTDTLNNKSRARSVEGPFNLFTEKATDKYQFLCTFQPYDNLQVRFDAERKSWSAARPETWFWGVACLFNQFRVTLEQPKKMEFQTVDASGNITKTERAPARVEPSGWNPNDPLYLGEKVVTYSSPTDSDVICGTLAGYNVYGTRASGSLTEAVYVEKRNDEESFVIDRELQEKLIRAGATFVKNGDRFEMPITVVPLFKYKDVVVEAVPQTNDKGEIVGRFKNELNGKYHVGDELPMDAEAAEGFSNWSYATYRADGYKNPGDRTPSEHAGPNQFAEQKVLKLRCRQYKLAPIFNDEGNYIAVYLDEKAKELFSFDPADILTEAEITASGKVAPLQRFREGWAILRTESPDKITPTVGKAYTVSLVPNDKTSASGRSIDGKLCIERPAFVSDWENVKVQGYCFDLIADGDPLRNLLRVTTDTAPVSEFQFLSLEGQVQYAGVTIRDSAEDLRTVPAMDVSVSAGANWIDGSPDKSKLARTVAASDRSGKFSLDGVYARPGDTVSVLMQHSGVWQVRYVTLGEPGSRRECTVSTPRFNPGTGEIVIAPERKECGVVNLSSLKRAGVHTQEVDNLTGAFNLPFRTPYTPYIRDFTFTHTNNAAGNTSGSRVEIVENDSVRYRFEVEDNGQKVEKVLMRFYNDSGVEQFSVNALPEATNSRYYVAIIPSSRMMPGYQLLLQIVSGEKETVIGPDGKPTQQDKFFPTLSSGLSFFVPERESVRQNINLDITKGSNLPPYIGDQPSLGSYASSADTGKLIYEEEFENPGDPEKGKKSKIVGLSVEIDQSAVNQIKQNWDKTTRHTGGSEKAKEAKGTYDEEAAKLYDEAKKAEEQRLLAWFPTDPQTREKRLEQWEKTAKSKDLYSEQLYRNGVASAAGDKGKVGFSLFLRFEYYYNEKDKQWDNTGYQLLMRFSGSTGKTFPFAIATPIGPIPAFLYVGGSIFFSFEIAYTYTKAESKVAEHYLKQSGNIAPVFSNASPWLTLGGSLEFWLGFGFNRFISVRGMIILELELKWNPNTSWTPNFGFNAGVKGGFGFDLVLVKYNWIVDLARQKKGAFYEVRPTYSQVGDDATLMSNEITADTAASAAALLGADQGGGFRLEALDMGQERYSVFDGDTAYLQSTAVPYKETVLVAGTLEYTRPQVVEADETHYLLFYLRNDAAKESGRDQANASSINYAMGTYNPQNGDIEWGLSAALETDGSFDTFPVVMKASDGRIYVAWSSAEASGSTDAQQVKADLSTMDIHMTWLAKQGDVYQPIGHIYHITDDAKVSETAYMNTSAILTEENGNIAVTYLKTDVDQMELENLISGSGAVKGAYSLWARKILDPATGRFVPQTTAAGKQVEELVLRSEADAYTPEYAAAVFRYGGKDYRISAYVLDREELSVEDSMELWVKVDDLTGGRSYAPMLVDKGDESLMGSKLTKANHRVRSQSGQEQVVSDLLLTWLTDGTVMNTLSAWQVFSTLEEESSTALISGLSADRIAQAGWAQAALNQVGDAVQRDDAFLALKGLASEPISYELASEKDFGETLTVTTISGEEEVERRSHGGLSLDGYQVVSGKDGNTYLLWVWPAGLDNYIEDDIGAEVWGSSYTRIVFDNVDTEDEDRCTAETWSNPVQITDCQSLDDTQMKDGRMIDELSSLVGTDSGAILLANTYDVRFNEKGEVSFGEHNLTQILCESDGSLEVSDPVMLLATGTTETSSEGQPVRVTTYSNDRNTYYPIPGNHYAIGLTLRNAGLLSTNNYTLTMEEIVDGTSRGTRNLILEKDEQGKNPLLSAGGTRTVYPAFDGAPGGEYVVPEYQQNLTLRFTIQEYAGDTPYETIGECEWSSNRLSAFDFHTSADITGYASPSLMTMDELAEIIDVFGSTREEIDRRAYEYAEMYGPDFEGGDFLDGRLLAMLNKAEDLTAWKETLEKNTPEGKIPYIAFIPVWNFGSVDAGELSAKVVFEHYKEGYAEPDLEIVGTGTLAGLSAGEMNYIVAPVNLSPDHFNDLGIVHLPVQVNYQGQRMDADELLLEYHTRENLGMSISVAEAGGDLSQDAEGHPVLNLWVGQAAALKVDAWPYGSDTVLYYAVGETETAEPGFTVELDGRVTAIRSGTGYVCAIDLESGIETKLPVCVNGNAPAPEPVPDSSGGGASGGETVTVAVRSDADTEPLTVIMNGTEAVVEELSADALARLTAPGANLQQKKEIIFDLRGLSQTAESVTIPANTFRALEDAIAASPSGGSLSVKTPDFTVLLDRASVASLAGNGALTVSVKRQSSEVLTTGQKTALEGKLAAAAYEVTVSRGGQTVADLGGGRMRVTVPMTPEPGRNGDDYRIYYLPESGPAEKVPASFVNGNQVFWISHCSAYAAVYEPGENSFTDVASGQFYTDPVLWAVSGGITTGTGADAFSPDASCTRAQMVTFLWRATGSPKPEGVDNPFKDVPDDAWYRDAVLWAVQAGVTNGTSADTFSPDQTVTRAQCVTFLWRDAVERRRVSGGAAFSDVPTDTWYSEAVAWAAAEKITLGTGDTEFSPDNPCKRSEIVTFLYRYFHIAE